MTHVTLRLSVRRYVRRMKAQKYFFSLVLVAVIYFAASMLLSPATQAFAGTSG